MLLLVSVPIMLIGVPCQRAAHRFVRSVDTGRPALVLNFTEASTLRNRGIFLNGSSDLPQIRLAVAMARRFCDPHNLADCFHEILPSVRGTALPSKPAQGQLDLGSKFQGVAVVNAVCREVAIDYSFAVADHEAC